MADPARKTALKPQRGTVALLCIDQHTDDALRTQLKSGYRFETFESHEPLVSALGLGSLHVDVLVIGQDFHSPLDTALAVRKTLRNLQVIVLAELRDVEPLRRQTEMRSDDADEITIWPSQHLRDLADAVRRASKRAHRRVRRNEDLPEDDDSTDAAKEAGSHLTQLLDRAPIGILTISRSGEVRTLNAQARELLCVTAGTAINRPIYDFFPVFEQRKLRALLRADASSDIRKEDRTMRVNAEERRYAEITVTGNVAQLDETCKMLILTDVTSIVRATEEQQRLAAALQASEERFTEMADAMQMIAWEGDPETLRIVSIGERIEEVLGYPQSRWLSRNFWVDRLHPEDRADTLRRINRDSQRLQNFELEFRIYDSEGKIRMLRNIVNVVRDESGRPLKVRGFLVELPSDDTA
ncbi:MAG: PAS domain-containing protein [Pseudomonadota bacterium]